MLSIGLVLTLVGLTMAVEMPSFTNSTQCVFMPTTKTLSCQFGTTDLTCSGVANFTVFGDNKFYLFGIEAVNMNTPVDNIIFGLYARAIDNTTYLNATVSDRRIALYWGPNFVHSGIRIIDSDCWGRLIKMFGLVTDFHPITVGGQTVNLIGEVMVKEESVIAKKWLYGYGFGYGYPYYGWGGYGGYGLGYYGYYGKK